MGQGFGGRRFGAFSVTKRYRRERRPDSPACSVRGQAAVRAAARPAVPDTGAVAKLRNGDWVLNPKSPFPLRLVNANRESAWRIKALLDQAYGGSHNTTARTLAAYMAGRKISCRQIDEFAAVHGPVFRAKVLKATNARGDWPLLTKAEREQWLKVFRRDAARALDYVPDGDLHPLFEEQAGGLDLAPALIKRFGYENLGLYVHYSHQPKAPRLVPPGHHERSGMEGLTKVGLAQRGEDIPLIDVLSTLSLRDLNRTFPNRGQQPFTRKANAIAFAQGIANAWERLDAIVAVDDLYVLQPLPKKFRDVDLSKISRCWRRDCIVAKLVIRTYAAGGHEMEAARRAATREDLSGWAVVRVHGCRMAQDIARKHYAPGRRPVLPAHIGCECTVEPIYGGRVIPRE